MKAQQDRLADTSTGSFAERIKILIQRVGSVTEIARMCGFSEGVVRSWRDGHTDPSRARCVKLAQTLGISLVWLVAGEGPLQTAPSRLAVCSQPQDEKNASPSVSLMTKLPQSGLDPERLNTAIRLLQSGLGLADHELPLAENSDLLSQLYGILGPGGTQMDPLAMVSFNQKLGERIRRAHRAA